MKFYFIFLLFYIKILKKQGQPFLVNLAVVISAFDIRSIF